MIKTRIGLLTDEALIKATMLKGLYYGCDFFRQMEQDRFFEAYSPLVDELLRNKNIIVACLEEDPDVILGYAIVSQPVLHYVYVKEVWRGQGIVRKMLQDLKITKVSHLTKIGNKIRIAKKLQFDPFDL